MTSAVDTRDLDGLCKAVDDGVAALGRLDVIVANAGISAPAAWNDITPEAFKDVMDINGPAPGTRSWPVRRRSSTAAAAARSS